MAARGPGDLSIREIVEIFRNVSQQLINSESDDLLRTQGLLRVAGSSDESNRIIESGDIPKIDKKNIHTALDVLKRILPTVGKRLEAIDRNNLNRLQIEFFGKNLSEDTIKEAAQGFMQYIDDLARSGEKEKEYIAEILYTYIHMATIISQEKYNSDNKMHPANIAIVLGPKFNELFNLVSISSGMDALSAASKSVLVNDVLMKVVESKQYERSFLSKYAASFHEHSKIRAEGAKKEFQKSSHGLSGAQKMADALKEDIKRLEAQILKNKDRIISLKKDKKGKENKEEIKKLKKENEALVFRCEGMENAKKSLEAEMKSMTSDTKEKANRSKLLTQSYDRVQKTLSKDKEPSSDSDSDLAKSPRTPRGGGSSH